MDRSLRGLGSPPHGVELPLWWRSPIVGDAASMCGTGNLGGDDERNAMSLSPLMSWLMDGGWLVQRMRAESDLILDVGRPRDKIRRFWA